MATEIEHKYLVTDYSYQSRATESHEIVQGYISRESGRTVRVRTVDNTAFLTIKGACKGMSRPEFEYNIPIDDARQLLKLCPGPVITKTRSIVIYEGERWEIDTFHGQLEGLVTAELEVPNENHTFNLPPFVGREVTGDHRFANSQLTTYDALKPAL